MAVDLIIHLKMDRSVADAESAAFHANEKARISKTLTDAEVAEKAKTEFIRRENAQRVQEAARATKTSVEQAKDAADQQKRIAKETADAQKKAAKDAADERKRNEKEVADDARQWSKRSLTDVEVAERAKTALVRRENLSRVGAVVDAVEREKGAVYGGAEAWNRKGGTIGMATKAVGGFVAAALSIRAVTTVLDAVDDRFRGIAEQALKAKAAAAAFNVDHLEAAGFAGTPGVTGEELRKSTVLAAASGLDVSKAAALRTAVGAGTYGVVDRPGIPGLISQDVLEQSTVLAAKQAAYSGGNPADYGSAVAMIPSIEGRRIEDPSEVESHLVRLDRLANIGGFGTPGDLVKELKDMRGYIQAGVVPAGEAEAMVALAARRNPAAAATIAKQGVTAASAGALMARGVHVEDDMKEMVQSQSAYFRSIGIGLNAGTKETSKKISDDLGKLPAGTNPDQYLLSKGMTNQQAREWFLGFHGDRPIWEKEIEPLLASQGKKGVIGETHAEWAKNDPSGRQAMVEATSSLATNATGQRNMLMYQLLEGEHSRLNAAGQAAGDFNEYVRPAAWYPDIGRMVKGTTPNALFKPLAQRITAEFQRLKIPTDLGSDNDGTRSSIYEELTGNGGMEYKAGIIDRASARVKREGGDPTFGQGDISRQILDTQKQIEKHLSIIAGNSKPPPPPALGRGGAPRQPSP